ncbi:hypothetical protein KFE25_011910 [Diacronema lutheri]|uniref:SRCR domain-containing protein n=1 Tax=Diacronema lutheri TaxID=2081491 RepID=A0A8J6C4Q6_DIALT|nr:hypothetical protein KFE25_011910 [Diacronema lutheri]
MGTAARVVITVGWLAALAPLAWGRQEALEDRLPHLEYARLFDAFHSWSNRLGRTYGSPDAKRTAIEHFYYNRKVVLACNEASVTTGFGCAINGFADESHASFNAARLRPFSKLDMRYAPEATHDASVLPGGHLPSSHDWATSSLLGPVRDQGACAGSYAFAATAAIESLHAIMTGRSQPLSEQMLISCAGGGGCDGDLPHNALGWVHAKGGLSSDASYPYLSTNGSALRCGCCGGAFGLCAPTQPECERALTTGGYFEIPSGDEALLLDAVAQQPVISAVDASAHTFMLYAQGVYEPPAGFGGKNGPSPNHAVVIVGYGQTAGNVAYWKVRNSWGSGWGEDGYVRIRRGTHALGIGSYAVYPATPTAPIRCAAPTDGDVRLSALPRGVVTVYENGAWRALCAEDKHVLVGAGNLVCKQLGYGYAEKAESYHTDATQTLLTGQRVCAQDDVSLLQCANRQNARGCSAMLGVECAPAAPGSAAAQVRTEAGAALQFCGSAYVPGWDAPATPNPARVGNNRHRHQSSTPEPSEDAGDGAADGADGGADGGAGGGADGGRHGGRHGAHAILAQPQPASLAPAHDGELPATALAAAALAAVLAVLSAARVLRARAARRGARV